MRGDRAQGREGAPARAPAGRQRAQRLQQPGQEGLQRRGRRPCSAAPGRVRHRQQQRLEATRPGAGTPRCVVAAAAVPVDSGAVRRSGSRERGLQAGRKLGRVAQGVRQAWGRPPRLSPCPCSLTAST
jgi:hypothetical protein